MKKKKIDVDVPQGKLTRIADFLPAPDKLAKAESTVKITIALNESSVEFFKKAAQKNNTKYQRMIRQILDRYAAYYESA